VRPVSLTEKRRVGSNLDTLEHIRMPTCQHCGSHVTKDYVRVFAPDGEEAPRVCPNCQTMIRDGATVRRARSNRR